MQHPEKNVKRLYSERALGDLLDMLDQLHTAASEGQVTVSGSNDIQGLLRDIIYTAQETLAEIDQRQPRLRVLKRPPA